MKRLLEKLANPYFLLVLTVVFWAGNSTVGRAVVGTVPPLSMSFFRWALASLIVLPFGLRPLWECRTALLKHWKVMIVLSVFSVTSFNTLLYLGLQHTTVVNASLVAGIMPVVIVVFSWLAWRVSVSGAQALGIFVSILGVGVIVSRGDLAVLSSLTFNDGDLIVLVAVVCWATYSVLLKLRPNGISGFAFLTATILIGTVFIAPLYVYEAAQGRVIDWGMESAAAIVYTAIFPSILAYIFWNKGVADIGANKAGMFVNLTPAVGVLFGVMFLDEAFERFHLVGIALTFFGVWLATIWKRKIQ